MHHIILWFPELLGVPKSKDVYLTKKKGKDGLPVEISGNLPTYKLNM